MLARHAFLATVLLPLGCSQILGLDQFVDATGGAGGSCDDVACLDACGTQGKLGACEGSQCVCTGVGGGGSGGGGGSFECAFVGSEFVVFSPGELLDLPLENETVSIVSGSGKSHVAVLAGGMQQRVFARTVSDSSNLGAVAVYPDANVSGSSGELSNGLSLPGRIAFTLTHQSMGVGQVEFGNGGGDEIQQGVGYFVSYMAPGCGNFIPSSLRSSLYQNEIYYAGSCTNQFDPWVLFAGHAAAAGPDVHAVVTGSNPDPDLRLTRGYAYFGGQHYVFTQGDDPFNPLYLRVGSSAAELSVANPLVFDAPNTNFLFGAIPRAPSQGEGFFLTAASFDPGGADIIPASIWAGSFGASDALAFAATPTSYLSTEISWSSPLDIGPLNPGVSHNSYFAAGIPGQLAGETNRKVVLDWWGPDGVLRLANLVVADYAGTTDVPLAAAVGEGEGLSTLVIWSMKDGTGLTSVVGRELICSAVVN